MRCERARVKTHKQSELTGTTALRNSLSRAGANSRWDLGAMEQINDLERNLEWKEKCDDIPTLCDADVFPAVDRCPQEARLHRDFHPESSVWLDGDRMGGRAGLGQCGRRATAGICNGWSGEVLRPMRSDDRGRSFLPELRPALVRLTIHTLLPKPPANVISPARSKSPSELRPPNIVIPMRATEGAR